MSGSFVEGKRAFWDLCGSENVQIKNYGSGKKDLGSLKEMLLEPSLIRIFKAGLKFRKCLLPFRNSFCNELLFFEARRFFSACVRR